MRAFIFSGGEWSAESLTPFNLHPEENDVVVAADSGASRALELGFKIDAVVGDMDSVDPEDLSRAEAMGAEIIRHPREKDALDFELAFRWALRRSSHIYKENEDSLQSVFILGTLSGRPDCAVAILGIVELFLGGYNLSDIGMEEEAHLDEDFDFEDFNLESANLEFYLDGTRAILLNDKRNEIELFGSMGDGLSLVSVGGKPAKEVYVSGARWDLQGEALRGASTRGVSNEFKEKTVRISTSSPILVFHTPQK